MLSEADKLILDKSKERLCLMFVGVFFVSHYVNLFQLAKHESPQLESALLLATATVFAKPCPSVYFVLEEFSSYFLCFSFTEGGAGVSSWVGCAYPTTGMHSQMHLQWPNVGGEQWHYQCPLEHHQHSHKQGRLILLFSSACSGLEIGIGHTDPSLLHTHHRSVQSVPAAQS